MISMVCPICKMDIYKQEWQDVWECPYCRWRSDREDAQSHGHLLQLTDSYPLA